MHCSPELILDYLNRERIRCTYGAFARVLGVPVRSAGRHLGEKRPYASWVVNDRSGEPTGYTEHERHPDLYRTSDIIRTEDELRRRMRTEPESRVRASNALRADEAGTAQRYTYTTPDAVLARKRGKQLAESNARLAALARSRNESR